MERLLQIGSVGFEIAFYQVHRAWGSFIDLGRSFACPTSYNLTNSHLSHESLDGAPCRRNTLSFHLTPYFPHPIDLSVLLPNVANLDAKTVILLHSETASDRDDIVMQDDSITAP